MSTPPDQLQKITFIQDDVPPLQTGVYSLTATQTVQDQPTVQFPAAKSNFVVQGERFAFGADEIQSVFPPPLANGEFDGCLPHVVFNTRTLPWQRALRNDDKNEEYEGYSWLAVLLFNDNQLLQTTSTSGNTSATQVVLNKVTAKDLIPAGNAITVIESPVTGTGTLAANILSYDIAPLNPTLNPMGYGETPDDPTTVIDIPIAIFNQVAPTTSDVQYLAHIREVDTSDGVDDVITVQQLAVVVGNRVPGLNTPSHAFLVSLENLADYLPNDDGTPSSFITSGIDTVRLITYKYWAFTANDMDEVLEKLLANLNTPPAGQPTINTLQLPITGDAPTTAQVDQALSDQAAGNLTDSDATTLVQNALLMGYVPFNHHLRHGGETVSWYRGPLAPYPIETTITVPISGPDAANAYNPQTGLFDVSYGAAWQLGQLLALQNSGLANSLYQWKQSIQQQQAVATEQLLLEDLLQAAEIFESILQPRADSVSTIVPGLPDTITDWFGGLLTLNGIPFNYLVPDERLLPPESLRFFYLDLNWIDALVDGAFSIGRATTGEANADAALFSMVRKTARAAMLTQRPNRTTAATTASIGPVTGFLIRSQAVSGWPNLRMKGFSDDTQTNEIQKLRLATLANDVRLCLFNGAVQMVVIEEPPEQLHMGLEGAAGNYSTTLREVSGDNPGQQYSDSHNEPVLCGLSMRSDQQTLQVADAATTLKTTLMNAPYSQTFPNGFTSAEFALEMNKGVVMVEYQRSTS